MVARPYAIHSDSECDRLEKQAVLAGLENHLRHVPVPKTARILDAGCGSGAMARCFASHFADASVIGVDIRDDQLGDVEHVILVNDNEPYVVIGHGGFLGLGEKQVAIALDNTVVQGDRLVTHGLTDDQIKAMASWDSKAGNYHELKGNQMAEVTVVR
jgi:SAM-dependent methyltransferase